MSQSKLASPDLTQWVVNYLDYVMIGISGAVFLVTVACALFTAVMSPRNSHADFNLLWRARFISQVLAAMYSLSLLLRLQVLWGPESIMVPGGYNSALLCRIYLALTFGVFEPIFLLVALFSCIYSVQGKGVSTHPNSSIIFFTLGFSLPVCAAQIICAIFTRIVDPGAIGAWIYLTFFSTYDTGLVEYCQMPGWWSNNQTNITVTPAQAPQSSSEGSGVGVGGGLESNCAFCVFPLFSTLISAAFAICYLLVAWRVTERIVKMVINRGLVLRIRVLQVSVATSVIVGVTCRGITVLFQPFDLAFEVLRCCDVICIAVTILAMSYVLVYRPVYDAHDSDKRIRKREKLAGGGSLSRWTLSLPDEEDGGTGLEERVAYNGNGEHITIHEAVIEVPGGGESLGVTAAHGEAMDGSALAAINGQTNGGRISSTHPPDAVSSHQIDAVVQGDDFQEGGRQSQGERGSRGEARSLKSSPSGKRVSPLPASHPAGGGQGQGGPDSKTEVDSSSGGGPRSRSPGKEGRGGIPSEKDLPENKEPLLNGSNLG